MHDHENNNICGMVWFGTESLGFEYCGYFYSSWNIDFYGLNWPGKQQLLIAVSIFTGCLFGLLV